MELDDQLRHYFGTADLASVAPEAVQAGVERMQLDLDQGQESGRRFALWATMHLLGVAPALDVAFTNDHDREHASTFMNLLAGFDGTK